MVSQAALLPIGEALRAVVIVRGNKCWQSIALTHIQAFSCHQSVVVDARSGNGLAVIDTPLNWRQGEPLSPRQQAAAKCVKVGCEETLRAQLHVTRRPTPTVVFLPLTLELGSRSAFHTRARAGRPAHQLDT